MEKPGLTKLQHQKHTSQSTYRSDLKYRLGAFKLLRGPLREAENSPSFEIGPFTRPYLHSNLIGLFYFSLILNRSSYELGGLSSIGGISRQYGNKKMIPKNI